MKSRYGRFETIALLGALLASSYSTTLTPKANPDHTYTDTTPSEAAQQAKLAAAESKRQRKRARNLAQESKR